MNTAHPLADDKYNATISYIDKIMRNRKMARQKTLQTRMKNLKEQITQIEHEKTQKDVEKSQATNILNVEFNDNSTK